MFVSEAVSVLHIRSQSLVNVNIRILGNETGHEGKKSLLKKRSFLDFAF